MYTNVEISTAENLIHSRASCWISSMWNPLSLHSQLEHVKPHRKYYWPYILNIYCEWGHLINTVNNPLSLATVSASLPPHSPLCLGLNTAVPACLTFWTHLWRPPPLLLISSRGRSFMMTSGESDRRYRISDFFYGRNFVNLMFYWNLAGHWNPVPCHCFYQF